jgi:hypothetical protein
MLANELRVLYHNIIGEREPITALSIAHIDTAVFSRHSRTLQAGTR